MLKAKIPEKAIENLWSRIEKGIKNWKGLIQNSFLTNEQKEVLIEFINTRAIQVRIKNFLKPTIPRASHRDISLVSFLP
jgi:serine/threonine-protein kinase HipA